MLYHYLPNRLPPPVVNTLVFVGGTPKQNISTLSEDDYFSVTIANNVQSIHHFRIESDGSSAEFKSTTPFQITRMTEDYGSGSVTYNPPISFIHASQSMNEGETAGYPAHIGQRALLTVFRTGRVNVGGYYTRGPAINIFNDNGLGSALATSGNLSFRANGNTVDENAWSMFSTPSTNFPTPAFVTIENDYANLSGTTAARYGGRTVLRGLWGNTIGGGPAGSSVSSISAKFQAPINSFVELGPDRFLGIRNNGSWFQWLRTPEIVQDYRTNGICEFQGDQFLLSSPVIMKMITPNVLFAATATTAYTIGVNTTTGEYTELSRQSIGFGNFRSDVMILGDGRYLVIGPRVSYMFTLDGNGAMQMINGPELPLSPTANLHRSGKVIMTRTRELRILTVPD